MRTSTRVLVLLLVAVLVLVAGWRATRGHPMAPMQASQPVVTPGDNSKILYWYDPMVPQTHFDRPGKSPFMDMQLVPKYESDGGQADSIKIDPATVQTLGVRTAPVSRGGGAGALRAVGAVELDERRIFAIESRAMGWVERLNVRAVGDPVRHGQVVAGVYAPDIFAAEQELALAAKSGDTSLVSASRQRLSLLGVSAAQVAALAQGGAPARQVAILAAADGVVTELNVREGAQVSPGTPLMRIADLSQVWVGVEVPESLSGRLHAGDPVQVTLSSTPGKTLTGSVDYIYPRLDTDTRTLRARIALSNPDRLLRPGMYAEVSLAASKTAEPDVLTVPTEAVIRTGTRSVVIVADGGGHFHAAPVVLGHEEGERTTIVAGLQEGQNVVASGQFLIDSEASLRGAYERLGIGNNESPGKEGDGIPPKNDGMTMPNKATP